VKTWRYADSVCRVRLKRSALPLVLGQLPQAAVGPLAASFRDASELLDFRMDQFPGPCPFIPVVDYLGRLEQSRRPAAPSARKRVTHPYAVCRETPSSAAI
jgi:hypothetical protein